MHITLLIWLLSIAGAPPQDDAIRAAFTTDEVILNITAGCERSEPLCRFEAEINAPPALFKSIEGVDYTYVPDRRISPAPITDASTHFHLKANKLSARTCMPKSE